MATTITTTTLINERIRQTILRELITTIEEPLAETFCRVYSEKIRKEYPGIGDHETRAHAHDLWCNYKETGVMPTMVTSWRIRECQFEFQAKLETLDYRRTDETLHALAMRS